MKMVKRHRIGDKMGTRKGLTSRIIGIAVLMTIISPALLACGPADESVQKELGNLTVAAPQDESSDDNGDPTATPEPTHMPTVCLKTLNAAKEVENICFVEPTPRVRHYSGIDGELSIIADDAYHNPNSPEHPRSTWRI